MTGRRLYDLHTDERRRVFGRRNPGDLDTATLWGAAPVAWPFLPEQERRLWNALAKRITPKRRKT